MSVKAELPQRSHGTPGGDTGGPPASAVGRKLASVGLRLVGLAAIVVIWQAVTSSLSVPSYILPQPLQLGPGLLADRSQILQGLRPLLLEAAFGFLGGNLMGIVMATLVNRFASAKTLLLPVALAIQSVPIVAITPLITLIVGFGFPATVAVATLITFFPMFINMTRGLVSIDPQAVEMFRILDAGEWDLFWKLRWPSALPYLFSAFKVTAPASILGAMVAEYIAANSGLGYMIQNASASYQYPLMWESMIVITVVVVLVFSAVTWLEQRLLPWATQR